MNAHIESGFWWQQFPHTLHQSETCYVHHSLADIDTKNCSRAKSIKSSVGRTALFSRSVKAFFLQKFDDRVDELKLTDEGSNWQSTQCESLCFFLVALINNWWLHGRSEIQFLQVAEGGLGGKDIAKTISSSFFPVHRIQLHCTPRNCNAL